MKKTKRILITGANSYIGTSMKNYLEQFPKEYDVEELDMQDADWKEKNFSKFDAIFHVAGIAHIKETKENEDLYYKVNRDLAIETAQKAKEERVEHFIFLSTLNIYGINTGVITCETEPNPRSSYGKSKWQAEKGINKLGDNKFKICIMRPPMVYGEGCKGNYKTLINFVEKYKVFPQIENRRSMVEIKTLAKYVKGIIDEGKEGIVFPQEENYICTSQLVEEYCKRKKINVRMTKMFNPGLLLMKKMKIGLVNKAFGNLILKE